MKASFKRGGALLLAVLLMTAWMSALAEPELSGSLVNAVKKALVYMDSGEYERIVQTVPFEDVAPGASKWKKLAVEFSSLGSGVEADKALCYYMSDTWIIAVPVKDDADTDCLVCTSRDGRTVAEFGRASRGSVEASAASATTAFEK